MRKKLTALGQALGEVIRGKDDIIELLLVALAAEGSVLLHDVPGVGKTTLAKSLAACLNANFRRIQFTPDLLPTDITGVSVFNQSTLQFEFRPGPVFSQVVLADEINRAGPRTQSALLEAMQERQVTGDGVTRPLERPFLVLATQNPIELEGTFPLPEAQLDRFLLRLSLGYPQPDEERAILRRYRADDPMEDLAPVLSAEDIVGLAARAREVFVHAAVEGYIVDLVNATRTSEALALGASPRATLALYHAAQALAALRGRDYVLPDDVLDLTEAVLAHRLIPGARMRLHGEGVVGVLRALVADVPVPVEENWAGRGAG